MMKSMTFVVRKAEPGDIAEIVRHMKILLAEHHKNDPTHRSPDGFRGLQAYIRSAITDDDHLVIVAEHDGQVVGYFLANTEDAPTYLAEKTIGVVADTCVHPDFRRKGAMTAMFEVALQWFKKQGVSRIELSVHERNKSAIAVWKKLGFKTYRLRMQRSL